MSILSKEKGLYSEELLQDDKSTLTGSYFEAFFDIPVTGDLSSFWDSLNRVEVGIKDIGPIGSVDIREYLGGHLGTACDGVVDSIDIGPVDIPEYATQVACTGVAGITDSRPVDICDRII